jgi:hypothetical protein
MEAAGCVPLLAGVCPKAGIAATAAKVTNKRKSRHWKYMLSSLPWLARAHRH